MAQSCFAAPANAGAGPSLLSYAITQRQVISLAGVRHFVSSHRVPSYMSTKDVVRSMVLPASGKSALAATPAFAPHLLPDMDSDRAAAAREALGERAPLYCRLPGCKLAGLDQRIAPFVYVVHAWCRPFMEMVNMLEKHFAGRPAEHCYVWLDVFALPQATADHCSYIEDIQRAIWYASHTLACVDPSGIMLSRLWCLYEMFYTLTAKQAAHALVAITPAPITLAQRTALYRRIDASAARCSVKEERRTLLALIYKASRRGLLGVNNFLATGLVLPPYDHAALYLPQIDCDRPSSGLGLFACMRPGPAAPPPPKARPPAASAKAASICVPGSGAAGAATQCSGQLGCGRPLGPGERPLRLLMGACNIPHPNKLATGGEDAFFLTAAGRGAMGVADGVGSWSSEDKVDPALYSRDLMRSAARTVEAAEGNVGVRMVLADAHVAVRHPGSATFCVALLAPGSNDLHVANLGDSGVRIFRGGQIVFETRAQAHSHNMPYQLACPDEPTCDTDASVQCDVHCVPLQPGDVIVMATDGLYDNVWGDTVREAVDKTMSAPPLLSHAISVAGGSDCGSLPAGDSTHALSAYVNGSTTQMVTCNLSPRPSGCSALGGCSPAGSVALGARGGSVPCPLPEIVSVQDPPHVMAHSVASASCGSAATADTWAQMQQPLHATASAQTVTTAPTSALTGSTSLQGGSDVDLMAKSSGVSYPTAPGSVVSSSMPPPGNGRSAPLSPASPCGRPGFLGAIPGEESDGIGKHGIVAGDDGQDIRADSSAAPLPPHAASSRAAVLARTLARTAASNMMRRDLKTPFAVELSKQNTCTVEFRANPRGGKPDDVTVVVAVVAEEGVTDDVCASPFLGTAGSAYPHLCTAPSAPVILGGASAYGGLRLGTAPSIGGGSDDGAVPITACPTLPKAAFKSLQQGPGFISNGQEQPLGQGQGQSQQGSGPLDSSGLVRGDSGDSAGAMPAEAVPTLPKAAMRALKSAAEAQAAAAGGANKPRTGPAAVAESAHGSGYGQPDPARLLASGPVPPVEIAATPFTAISSELSGYNRAAMQIDVQVPMDPNLELALAYSCVDSAFEERQASGSHCHVSTGGSGRWSLIAGEDEEAEDTDGEQVCPRDGEDQDRRPAQGCWPLGGALNSMCSHLAGLFSDMLSTKNGQHLPDCYR
ncbi:hypothetical protein HYH03_014689 [Edaphochlamys debaryana]|uniref:PPM-type phosphatase domain-containing protein n=1 Tax=Edaphochlamys debaryana TaxID=47281 RepID=A0A835XM65_9CHLO|nr:hypothetical protein HYH03_014689 [Edaphochlamys debaryana]|eukprot:KAG2486633.1 hypothetical protein HYH03_014689 [Edaphochlamys debaryana]